MNRSRNLGQRLPRSNNNTRRMPPPDLTQNVPSTRQVIPGARVSIVLKADQPTGKEVNGVVQDLLTRGDHPRGIKVRLQDGRVGRVQKMMLDSAPTATSLQPSTGSGNVTADGESEYTSKNSASLNLGDFIVTRGGKGNRKVAPTTESASDLAVCPICGDFTGDEVAVSHHVQQHLDGEIPAPG